MSRIRFVSSFLLTAGTTSLALVMALASVSKLTDPHDAFETAQAVTGDAWWAAGLVILATLLEWSLFTATWTRILSKRCALLGGLILLVLFTGWLFFARNRIGGGEHCGCLTLVRKGTITNAILSNCIFIAELLTVLAASLFVVFPPPKSLP